MKSLRDGFGDPTRQDGGERASPFTLPSCVRQTAHPLPVPCGSCKLSKEIFELNAQAFTGLDGGSDHLKPSTIWVATLLLLCRLYVRMSIHSSCRRHVLLRKRMAQGGIDNALG